jgi:hypothetical protein
MLPLKCSRFLWFNKWDKISCFKFLWFGAFGESLSFYAQKKVTPEFRCARRGRQKGILPLLLSRHGGTKRPAHNYLYYWLQESF